MRKILITGVTGGIGSALAENLLSKNYGVIGLCRNINDKVKSLINENPDNFFVQECDLMNVESIPDLLKNLISTYGSLGGFVHCAGFDKLSPITRAKLDDIKNLWTIHALVPMIINSVLCKKNFHDENNTSIVLISSQAAHEGAMGHSYYASAKGALEGYLPPAAAELMEKNIRLNIVSLAPIKTNMFENWFSMLTEDSKKKLSDSYPLGMGKVSDAVNLIEFLLSEDSRFINGQIITADGGHSVRKI